MMYLVLGAFCTAMAGVFAALHHSPPRLFADDRFMSWERDAATQ
jgi:hypothetical protein